MEWISSELDDITDEIVNTEGKVASQFFLFSIINPFFNAEHLELQIGLRRNRILQFELLMMMATFAIATGALLSGFFGMNLLNHLEQNTYAFYAVTAFVAINIAIVLVLCMRYAKFQNIL